jgi:hypothetical protein
MSIANHRWTLIAAIAVLIVHGAAVLHLGVVVPPDGAKFSGWADSLIANRFDFGAVVGTAAARNLPAGMYMFFVTLVALAKIVAGAKWATLLVGVNLICDALTAAILVHLVSQGVQPSRPRSPGDDCGRAGRPTSAGGTPAILAIAFWLLCFDVVTWVRMPLTDVPFLLTSFAAFAALVAQRKWLAALLAATSLVLRPVGFLWLILLAVVYLVMSGRVGRRSVIAGGLVVAALMFVGHTLLVRHPERWPMGAFARGVRWDARSYQRGDVVFGRPETSHAPPSTFVDYAAITADRFVHFFAFTAPSFSRAHKLANAAFYFPLYLLAIIGVVRRRDADVAIFCALIVLAVAFWHSLVIVDYDWRYRLPVLPHLIVIAACAIPSTKSRLPPWDG